MFVTGRRGQPRPTRPRSTSSRSPCGPPARRRRTPPSPTRAIALTPTSRDKAGASGEALRLRAEGLVALAGGDFAGARALLERAAEAGDARALLVLGDTYDPATLARMGALGLKGDAARARDYYARALSPASTAARERIAALEAQQDDGRVSGFV